MLSLRFLLILLFFSSPISAQPLDTLQLSTIFQPPYLAGVRAEFQGFSANGQSAFFEWSPDHTDNLKSYELSLSDGEPSELNDTPPSYTISPNNKRAAHIKEVDIWLTEYPFDKSRRLTKTPADEEDLHWSPDGNRLAYVLEGDVWVIDIDPFSLIQVTDRSDTEAEYEIEEFSGDSKHLILRQEYTDDQPTVYFPRYVDLFVEPGGDQRGHERIVLSYVSIDAENGRVLYDQKGRILNVASVSDGGGIIIDQADVALKKRTISLFDTESGTERVFWTESTEGWIYPRLTALHSSPDGSQISFISEKDGWAHLYVKNVTKENFQAAQITKGLYEVSWHRWLDNERVVYLASKEGPGERHLYITHLAEQKTTQLTERKGFRKEVRLSPDKRRLIYRYSETNMPWEYYALDLENPQQEQRLTYTIPERFKAVNWQEPKRWTFTGRDEETEISMMTIEPVKRSDRDYAPVVVFVHGAGSLQNVYNGWSDYYYREYLFHQFLAAQGYAVVEVDYRHSTGYGRDFREDVTGWMGKYELQDIIDGLDHAQKQLGYLDLDNVGIYGGSYGGFMALYAVSRAPERFKAAAALRAVTNWENYYYANPEYTEPRLGTPQRNRENYKRSSPITYADSLTRPVLLLHGLEDDNVGFQDIAQYTDRLIQSGHEDFELMIYPSEAHSFQDPDAWEDEYRRIYRFFNERLRK